MKEKNDLTIRNIIGSFLPVVCAIALQYIVNAVDVLVIFIRNLRSEDKSGVKTTVEMIMSQDYNQPMNLAYMTLAQHLLYLLCFGFWYYKVFYKTKDESARGTASLQRILISVSALCMVAAGIAGQIFVDGVLSLARPMFETAFANYDKLVSRVTGVSSSAVMLIAVVALAPVGEELLFRGVIQRYSLRYMPAGLAILFQGVLFGLYHGNTIQGIYAFCFGVLLGYLAYRFDTVIFGMVFHLALNASLLFVPAAWFSTTNGSLLAGGIGLAVLAATLILAIKKYKKTEE